jgi:mannosyltransferase OCH1-like enzyme
MDKKIDDINNLQIEENEIKIPLNIYQTWISKYLERHMRKASEKIKKNNPEFKYYLFDDRDCRKFISDHFSHEILYTYDNIIPGAYKADLWRYCVLYINGGIYIDIKYEPIDDFKFIDLINKEYYVKDRNGLWINDKIGIYNAFMICYPKNEILLKCINQIVVNTKNNFYGHNALYPTGPGLLGLFFDINHKFDFFFSDCGNYILYQQGDEKIKVLKMYDNYRHEQSKYQYRTHYTILWEQKKIYFTNILNSNKPFDLSLYKSEIPLIVYQVNYCNKKINKDYDNKLKSGGFKYHIFSLFECGEFLRKNFDFKFFLFFNKIKSTKLKTDFWKYCFLNKYGGFYFDINFEIDFNKANLFYYSFNNHYLYDCEKNMICGDILITKSNNTNLLFCTNKLLTNIANKIYDSDYENEINSILNKTVIDNDKEYLNFIYKENKIYTSECVLIDNIDIAYTQKLEEATKLYNNKNIY